MVDGGWIPKRFPDFCSKFYQIKFTAYKSSVFWKICEKLFLSEKKSNFKFQNRGYFPKKMFRKFLETSVMISLLNDNSLYFGKQLKKKIRGKNQNLIFKIEDFLKKNQNSHR